MRLTPDLILQAYANGCFPMADARDSADQAFYHPIQRGVFDLSQVRVPRRLARRLRGHPFTLAIDQDFAAIVAACADTPRAHEAGTWINDEIERVFGKLHALGHAHCLGAYDDEGRLVGGLYGLHMGSLFFGESMFSHATDASKACLVALFAALKRVGFRYVDAQMPNAHLSQFGLENWPNERFLKVLEEGLKQWLPFPREINAEDLEAFLLRPS